MTNTLAVGSPVPERPALGVNCSVVAIIQFLLVFKINYIPVLTAPTPSSLQSPPVVPWALTGLHLSNLQSLPLSDGMGGRRGHVGRAGLGSAGALSLQVGP